MAENQGLNIREGTTYLDVQSKKGKISFVAPAFGYGNYVNVGNQISEAGLEQPTMEQTAHLVYGAWQNPKEKYSADIINKLRDKRIFGFNGLLYFPNEGIYIQDRPEIKNGKVVMDKNNLVEKLEAKDPSVRFVSFGTFERQTQSSLELAKNPFVQALAREEGADKIAQSSDNYNFKPIVWALDNVREPTIYVAHLHLYLNRLGVGGIWGGNFGCGFGILTQDGEIL